MSVNKKNFLFNRSTLWHYFKNYCDSINLISWTNKLLNGGEINGYWEKNRNKIY